MEQGAWVAAEVVAHAGPLDCGVATTCGPYVSIAGPAITG